VVLDSEQRGGGAGADTDLRVDVLQMMAHSVLAEHQLIRDLASARPAREHAQDLGGSLIFTSIGLGAFSGTLGLSRYIPRALAIGRLTIVAINWLYCRQTAARMLVGDPICDCGPVRRTMVISGTAGLLIMAATFCLMQWLDHTVVNSAHMMSRPEYIEAWLAGVRNDNATYMGLSVVVGTAILTLLPLPRARAALTPGLPEVNALANQNVLRRVDVRTAAALQCTDRHPAHACLAALTRADTGEGSSKMGEVHISRRRLVGAGAVGALGVLLAPEAVLADSDNHKEVELLRWDLVQPTPASSVTVVVAGGTDVARDAATGDTVSLTGSGEARPHKGKATGGGTFVHQHSNGSEVGHGVYVVTGFKSFSNGGGSLAGIGLTDGIDDINKTTGGILTLGVHLTATSGQAADAVLEVHCELPGSTPTKEGVRLTVPAFHLDFVQQSGFTLFHVLED
jgi:hypothetical protein